ncbi:hypothetical protein SG34_002190 [Thalassomonas viridans]|uniref:Uncharacterized protein n=1 Tax=Thalassomonas viridans TaxID=137584 RepID=A0AAE9Z4A8_9GAMM|nr:hypothetical protein [Thalassomonas viridans]WDE05769.1 hypothetical protein SG34_002190 [Thalassomonas viridans]
MNIFRKISSSIHRKLRPVESHAIWQQLNLAQKFAVRSLAECDYELCFIRTIAGNRLVVMICGENFATIDSEGEIDMHPDIKLRYSL